MWNPLRTLSGRLILVTIAAIGLSNAAAIVLLMRERGDAMRRVIETTLSQRIADAAKQVRDAPANARAEALAAATGGRGRFSLATAPIVETTALTGAASRVARAVSSQLGGAEVRAATRRLRPNESPDWPVRGGPGRPPPPGELEIRRPFAGAARAPEGGVAFGAFAGAPPPSPFMEEGPPPPAPFVERKGPEPPRMARGAYVLRTSADELSVSVKIAPRMWLNLRTPIPAPRPLPRFVIFTALGSILAMSMGAVLVARQIARPLADLAVAAERLGHGRSDVAAPVRGPDDVRRASIAFNEMADRLRRQLGRQRQMLWALSHDLRTPITALRLRAELIEDETVRARLLAPLKDMETLAAQALSLARAGAGSEERVEVDLAEMAHTLCNELQELGMDVKAAAPDAVRFVCCPNEIARAMRNLAENAAVHGGGGLVRVAREGKAVVIEAQDEGPGIPDDTRERVTAPFFRVDAARAAGAGLGLAITQAIAEGHGGRLILENRRPHGLIARIVLPSANGASN